MGEKCDSHDDCFGRLYNRMEGMDSRLCAKMESIDDKLDRQFRDLHNRLHEGDLRFAQFEMRLAQCEKTLSTSQSGKLDIRRKAVGVAFDLLKLAVIALFGAACWAFANGYQG